MPIKVYITNKSGHSHGAAMDLFPGENVKFIYLTEGVVPALKTNKAYRLICEKLEGSKASDFLLQSGPSILNMLASAVFARKHGTLNLLLYRHGFGEGSGRYVVRKLDLDSLLEKEE